MVSLTAGLVPGAAWAQQRQELDALRARMEKLRAALQDTEENRSEAREELRESEVAVSRSLRELRAISVQRQALQAQLRSLDSRTKDTHAAMAAREQQLARLLSAAYRGGEAGYLRLLLSGDDPNQTARDLHYLAHISRAHAETLQAARDDLERLSALQLESREKTAELDALEKAHKTRHAELERQRAARRQLLQRVSVRLRAQKQQVQMLARDEKRLARLVEELGRVVAAVPPSAAVGPFASLRGRLALPVRGVVANRFGTPRVEGGPSWKGIFIRTAPGEEVRSVAAGRVVFAEWMRGLGNLLVVDHGQGYLTIYGNNESVYRTVGDEVRGGDVVASAGASGGTQETGLYFEIRHEGRAFDPLSWVVKR